MTKLASAAVAFRKARGQGAGGRWWARFQAGPAPGFRSFTRQPRLECRVIRSVMRALLRGGGGVAAFHFIRL
jgi:hypothetical protein